MNERINRLREQSLNAVPKICTERAELLTDFYQSDDARSESIPVTRAKAFEYILLNKDLCINEGELIVGERGSAPKATPTYPEICTHSPKDLEILDSRKNVSFKSDSRVKQIYREKIIPFWKNRSIREKIFAQLDKEWLDAYQAGIFTEFQEQRAPGHTVNGDKIYKKGFRDLKEEIKVSLKELDFYNDPQAFNRREELKAMDIAAGALIAFAKRYAASLEIAAEKETDTSRKKELKAMAKICHKVPLKAPDTFWEALQYYWFVHLGVITEFNTWDSFNPGRLDQHLYPFYQKEIDQGTLTPKRAKELLCSFWIKFNNQPAPPKVGVTALESNTYTDFSLINLGGVTREGQDGVNDLTYLILEVIEDMRILQPSSMIQVSKQNPDEFIRRALKIIKTGFGQPSVFNTDAIIAELVNQGKTIGDARDGGASGCVEAGAFGREAYFLTGYFNLVKILEIALFNGYDPKTREQIGLKTGEIAELTSLAKVLKAFKKQVNHFVDIKIKGNNIIERIYSQFMPAPFLSLLIDDCIQNGEDYHSGGARYNTSYIQGVGLGSLTDSLTSIKYNVFDEKLISIRDLQKVLQDNFTGYEDLRKRFVSQTPKFGNDDDYADQITREIFDIFYQAVNGRPNTRGGQHRINLLPTTVHVYFGSVTGAMPDGRKAGEPLSEGISPVQGADKNGPTSVIKSVSKIDHIKTGGTLLNMKFSPAFFKDDVAIDKLVSLIRAHFKLDSHHIQFNVIDAATLRKAQKNPEKYRNLIVRVAGYSDYFNDLGKDLQEEIIRRTAHESC